MSFLILIAMMLGPIALFVYFDSMKDAQKGMLYGVMAVVLFSFLYMAWVGFSPSLLVEPVIFVICGSLGYFLRNSRWFKYAPCLAQMLLFFYLVALKIFQIPFGERMRPLFQKMLDQMADSMIQTQQELTLFLGQHVEQISREEWISFFTEHMVLLSDKSIMPLAFVLFIHSLMLYIVVSRNDSSLIWAGVRFLVYPMMFLIFLYLQIK